MLYAQKEASSLLGISTNTLERYALAGKIDCSRMVGWHRDMV